MRPSQQGVVTWFSRFRRLARPLPILVFSAMAVAAFGFSHSRVPTTGPRLLADELTPAQARQALIELVKDRQEGPRYWRLAELKAGDAMAIVDREDQGLTWTFNCNLKARSFTYSADKLRGCSFHFTGEFQRVAGKWQASMQWDSVACSK